MIETQQRKAKRDELTSVITMDPSNLATNASGGVPSDLYGVVLVGLYGDVPAGLLCFGAIVCAVAGHVESSQDDEAGLKT